MILSLLCLFPVAEASNRECTIGPAPERECTISATDSYDKPDTRDYYKDHNDKVFHEETGIPDLRK